MLPPVLNLILEISPEKLDVKEKLKKPKLKNSQQSFLSHDKMVYVEF